nr:tetratricopeptide repeat protein [Nitrospirota bacterium]
MELTQAFAAALRYHTAGKLAEAEQIYRQILAQNPRHADALHLLGVIAHQSGRDDVAIEFIAKAVAVNPAVAEYHNNLGNALLAMNKVEEAGSQYRQALARKPDYAEAHAHLANVLMRQGKLDEAAALCRQAVALRPGYAEAHYILGNAHAAQGRLEDAVTCYGNALTCRPGYADAYYNLGNVLKSLGRLTKAAVSYSEALAVQPAFTDAQNGLGLALQGQGMLTEAADCFRGVLELDAAHIGALTNLATTLVYQGRQEEAAAYYEKALAVGPENSAVHSICLFNRSYTAEDPAIEARKFRKWNERYAEPLGAKILRHGNDPDPRRRLRVGYVSGDFWSHPTSYFLESLIAAHDRSSVEVLCYSNGALVDATTQRLQALADDWRLLAGMSDEAVAGLVRADGIDILVDLSGHASGNRLPVFAQKPAPVQVTYLGSLTTTGLKTMDYRLTDRHLTPPRSPEWFSEKLIRLPACFACYGPPANAPAVAPLPAAKAGHVTFGSFNNLAKVTPSVVALWSRILRLLPDARLLLRDVTFADGGQRARYLEIFKRDGIQEDRIELLPRAALADYLETYGRIDIALDPFPYNGCTTTCEALWMGAPVVTLAGVMSYGRFGVSLLSTLGLEDLIATTPEAYVKIAVDLAKKQKRLAELRGDLRARMSASALCDAKAMAQGVERAYRTMWKRWCESVK